MSQVAFWDKDERPILMLISPDLFDVLPNGTILWSIRGEQKVKGKDTIDGDTRGGFLAVGFRLEHERDPLGREHRHDHHDDAG